jgi:hypothetical protein
LQELQNIVALLLSIKRLRAPSELDQLADYSWGSASLHPRLQLFSAFGTPTFLILGVVPYLATILLSRPSFGLLGSAVFP